MSTEPTPSVDAASGAASAAPVLRVVAGNPNDEELAAAHAVIAAVLAEQASHGAERVVPTVSRWSRPLMRPAVEPGVGAWTASRGVRGC